VLRLAGCDLLTISPDILARPRIARGRRAAPAVARLGAREQTAAPLHLDEKTYRFMQNEDAMAVDKLSDGIRKFHADALKLKSGRRASSPKAA